MGGVWGWFLRGFEVFGGVDQENDKRVIGEKEKSCAPTTTLRKSSQSKKLQRYRDKCTDLDLGKVHREIDEKSLD